MNGVFTHCILKEEETNEIDKHLLGAFRNVIDAATFELCDTVQA